MIIVTGAAGFIGSCLVEGLNRGGFEDLILVDKFDNPLKNQNLAGKVFLDRIDRDVFFSWIQDSGFKPDFVFHIGARTDTAEFDTGIFDKLNLNFSKSIWKFCVEKNIPLIYASSAATYGLGEWGYDDDMNLIEKLKPLNPYGESKNNFDKWVLLQQDFPPRWYGLKFFNVYGPNEYHKNRMASVIFHAFNQISATGTLKLFKSHKPDFEDGKQLRDFVYVKDVIKVMLYLQKSMVKSGIFNLGTGTARSFLDLAHAVFHEMNKVENIEFVDTPVDIREKYQYFTEAKMEKLIGSGYNNSFISLEDGISDYIKNYLNTNKRY